MTQLNESPRRRFSWSIFLTWVLLISEVLATSLAADARSLKEKFILGYQGWFACPGDSSGTGLGHWKSADEVAVDFLPDISELPKAARCPSGLKNGEGRPVELFSSYDPATLDRHFDWLEHYGIDGVALQRFATELQEPQLVVAHDRMLHNLRVSAERHGRVFFLMYDLSGLSPDQLSVVARDWDRLERGGLTGSPSYLRHRGHPLIAIWGLGFAGRPLMPSETRDLFDTLAHVSAPFGGVTVLAGVPSHWRTGDKDASPDPGWQDIWRRVGVISPWSVGRYSDDASADAYRQNVTEPDLKATRALGVDYMPVIFPGYSFANTTRAHHDSKAMVLRRLNEIPRRCGRFFWRQVSNALGAGASMLYGAMFDELNEGTAMFKMLPKASDAPVQGIPPGDSFVTLDADGCDLPSDWYLRLGGAAAAAVRNHERPTPELPISLLAH